MTRIQIRPLKEAPDPDPTDDENPGRLRGNLTVRLFSMIADPVGVDPNLDPTVDEKKRIQLRPLKNSRIRNSMYAYISKAVVFYLNICGA